MRRFVLSGVVLFGLVFPACVQAQARIPRDAWSARPAPRYPIEPSYSVTIQLRDSDSTVTSDNSGRIHFITEAANAEWLRFIAHFRDYFFNDVPQPDNRYSPGRMNEDSVREFTQLHVRFTDIAYIVWQTYFQGKYTYKCPANPLKEMDQDLTLLLYPVGDQQVTGAWSRGLAEVGGDFERVFLSQKPRGREEYTVRTGCEQITTQLLLDWRFVKAITVHKPTRNFGRIIRLVGPS